MAESSPDQIRAQWLLAGRLNGALCLVQMLIFAIVMIVYGSVVYVSNNFWALILGFSINGVVAVVCLARARRRTAK
jgi:membrane protein implicated in regulation of membrane protease activity